MAVRELEPGELSEQALLILVSLAGGPKHGYAMIQDIADVSGRRLGPGTLYGAIARLERAGLIEPLAPDERRITYRLTDAGARYIGALLYEIRSIHAMAPPTQFPSTGSLI